MLRKTENFFVWRATRATVATSLVTITCLPAHGDGNAERYFHFIDQRGVPHYTNVPVDPRYAPIELRVRNFPSAPALKVYQPKLQESAPQSVQEFPQTPDDIPEANVASERG